MNFRCVLLILGWGAGCALSQDIDCSVPTLTITSAAQATDIPCRTLEGSVLIGRAVQGSVELQGPEVIKGDLIVNDVSGISSLSSRSLGSVEGTIDIDSNNPSLDVEFANLIQAHAFAVNNTRSFEVPALTSVNDSMRFGQNGFEVFSAEQLTRVSGSVVFTNNTDMARLEFPLLERIDAAFIIADNPSLEFVNGFPELNRVLGAIFLDGDFKYVELPSLSEFYGTFLLRSTQRLGDTCAAFQDMADRDPANREFDCQGEYQPPTDDPAANSPEPSGSSSSGDGEGSGLGGGAIAGIVVGGVVGLAVIATVVFCLMRRRKKRAEAKRKAAEAGEDDEVNHLAVPELHGAQRYELAAPTPELVGSKVPEHYAYHEADGTPSTRRSSDRQSK